MNLAINPPSSADGPPLGGTAPSGGSVVREATSVGDAERSEGPPRASSAPSGGSVVREATSVGAPFRIGEGWDTHALVPGRLLIIGGVTVPHSAGLLGHSDADVLLHAIIDGLLGAAGLGDIGGHFPDTDARFKGADSVALLRETGRLLVARQLRIGNIDCTVIAQAPKLAGHIPAMRQCIAEALDLDVARVNVKAKTAEKLGPVGQGLSIEARAVVLLF